MKQILFINACPRPNSRTLELAWTVLDRLEGAVEQVFLYREGPEPLTWESLEERTRLVEQGDCSHPMFRWARQFARADEIVIAAPYWDLMFPAPVRSYLESVTVSGVTFEYSPDGQPNGLCRAQRLIYVTTAGGPIVRNFGYDYAKALANTFFGIEQTVCVRAEGLDIRGADPEAILARAKAELTL